MKKTKQKYLDPNIKYTQHQFGKIQRPMNADERRKLKGLIERAGRINDAILLVVDGNKNQIGDGWNRYEISKELRIPCPYELWTGDAGEELLNKIEERGSYRLKTPSEAAFEANEFMKARQGLRGGQDEIDENANPAQSGGISTEIKNNSRRNSGIVEEAASRSGASATTIKKLRKIEEADPKLYAAVGDGKLTVNAAEAKLKEKESEESEAPVVDGMGKELTNARIIAVFRDEPYKALLKSARALKKAMKDLKESKDGGHIDDQTMVYIENVCVALNYVQPYTLCQYCGASGARGCKACNGTGFISEKMLAKVPEEDRCA